MLLMDNKAQAKSCLLATKEFGTFIMTEITADKLVLQD
jgi:hypothetical protein